MQRPNQKCEWCKIDFFMSQGAKAAHIRHSTPYLCSVCRKKRNTISSKRSQQLRKEKEKLIRQFRPKFSILYKQKTGRDLRIAK